MGETEIRSQATVIDAAKALLAVCDGASTRDTHGFNGVDAPFVHDLFKRKWLTLKQLEKLHTILEKYAKQLLTHGFVYESLSVPIPGPRTSATGSKGVPTDPLASAAAREASAPLPPPPVAPMRPAPEPPKMPREIAPWPVKDITPFFPAGFTPRPQQVDCLNRIQKAYASGKKIVVLEMATGGGKSFLCMAVANALKAAGGRTHFLTSLKVLQGQYEKDFPTPQLEILKGRANYPCSHEKGVGNDCSDAPCTRKGKGLLKECIVGGDQAEVRKAAVQLQLDPNSHRCPYWKNLQKCSDSDITLFNFSSFLFQRRVDRFTPRDLMIIDEAHLTEAHLMSYVNMEITEWTLRHLDIEIDQNITSKQQLVEWLREKQIATKIQSVLDVGREMDLDDESEADGIGAELDRAAKDALRELGGKIENFLRFLDVTEWILETVEYKDGNGKTRRKILARPVYATAFAQGLLFSNADRLLVMSATFLDVKLWARNLGLKIEDIEHIDIPSDFPVENRPIHLEYCGDVGYKWFSPLRNPSDPTQPKFVAKIKQLIDRHACQRGMIHCQSFELSKVIRTEVASSRFLFQEDFDGDKDAMLREHSKRTDTIIVAPGMKEGLDLKDELARFQILCKTPYPSMADKVVKERMSRDQAWFSWNTALSVVQMLGRAVRHKNDYAYTYIIDSGFSGFFARNSRFFPKWVTDAFQKYPPREIRRG